VFNADPTNGIAGQLLGRALHSLGDEAGARRALAMTTGMGAYLPDPWHEEILWSATGVGNLLRLLSARMARGEIEPVIAELEELRRSHPRDVGVLNKLSEGYLHRRDPQASLDALRVAYEEDPEGWATLVHLAQTERMLGNGAAALQWADRAVAANPRLWQVHFERAGILHQGGRYADCVAALEEALKLGAHQNPNAWLMKGDAHIRLADWEGAAATFGPAAERFPFLGQAFIGLAIAEVERGRAAEARAALTQARQLQPQDQMMGMIQQRIDQLEGGGG
jgi:tetratricopeptide (TPR) repeat protein